MIRKCAVLGKYLEKYFNFSIHSFQNDYQSGRRKLQNFFINMFFICSAYCNTYKTKVLWLCFRDFYWSFTRLLSISSSGLVLHLNLLWWVMKAGLRFTAQKKTYWILYFHSASNNNHISIFHWPKQLKAFIWKLSSRNNVAIVIIKLILIIPAVARETEHDRFWMYKKLRDPSKSFNHIWELQSGEP